MLPKYRASVEKMPELFGLLMQCEMHSTNPRQGFPKRPGVYALFENGSPVYVGRARNIWQRIGNHTGGRPEQSSFAFKLARQLSGRLTTYTPTGSRKSLMQDELFQASFSECVSRIRGFSGRFVVIEDDIEQHLFEVYAALALETPYNEFRTS